MAALWVVAGVHCRLEVLPGFEFLSCSPHLIAEGSAAQHTHECGDDGCQTVELGSCRHSEPQPVLVNPAPALIAWRIPLPDDYPVTTASFTASPSLSPPDLTRAWQFSQRAARPARAPSAAS